MKLSTSLKNANKVSVRLRSLAGLIETPYGNYDGIKVSRAWLFGSTARGKHNPNDTDILLEYRKFGSCKFANSKQNRMNKIRGNARTDKEYKRRCGIVLPISSEHIAFMFLRKNLKKVSLHDIEVDGKYATDKILIYARNDLGKVKNSSVGTQKT